MLIFVGVIALVACGIALVLLPLRLPWSQRVRWIVAAHAMGGWGMSAEPTIMREVFVVDLYDTTPARVVVRHAGVAAVDTTLVLPAAPQLSIIAQLARWRAAGTPLLLVSDGSRDLSLHGPSSAVCGLSSYHEARAEKDLPWSTA